MTKIYSNISIDQKDLNGIIVNSEVNSEIVFAGCNFAGCSFEGAFERFMNAKCYNCDFQSCHLDYTTSRSREVAYINCKFVDTILDSDFENLAAGAVVMRDCEILNN